ncbi:Hypothetical protein FKW44_013037 [Caligus rogercresseyi]|uniref:Uncharacterized protein n=1 Tax=Caligus rogercresseyi TaxID=217165 RepID=A0A7T8HK76_CALRO|nr:Hypothetical protein FKW44_013037 [Caligus rogercresseyi]
MKKTLEMIAAMKRLIDDNPRMTTRQVAAELFETNNDTRDFLTQRDVEQVKQSPYSSALNLCDLFWNSKYLLRNDEFEDHEDATLAV